MGKREGWLERGMKHRQRGRPRTPSIPPKPDRPFPPPVREELVVYQGRSPFSLSSLPHPLYSSLPSSLSRGRRRKKLVEQTHVIRLPLVRVREHHVRSRYRHQSTLRTVMFVGRQTEGKGIDEPLELAYGSLLDPEDDVRGREGRVEACSCLSFIPSH